MGILLTHNGIPPQIICSLSSEQKDSLSHYAASDMHEISLAPGGNYSEAVKPFGSIANSVVDRFVEWGASTAEGTQKLEMKSSFLNEEETTFAGALNLHSDRIDAYQKLQTKNILSVRVLCVSSCPGKFINLTKCTDIPHLLAQYAIGDGRFYRAELLDWAEAAKQVVQPDTWDVIIFDALTPHKSMGALRSHQRILQHAFVDIGLPSDWHNRVLNGDVPKW